MKLDDSESYQLTLFVAGLGARTTKTLANLRRICREYLGEDYRLDVVDVETTPGSAEAHNILITPTLIRHCPLPLRRIVGDLSDAQAVVDGLDFEALAVQKGKLTP